MLRRNLEFERVILLADLDPARAAKEIGPLLAADDSISVDASVVTEACFRAQRLEEAIQYAQQGLQTLSKPSKREICAQVLLRSLVALQAWEDVLDATEYLRGSERSMDPMLLRLIEECEAKAKQALGRD